MAHLRTKVAAGGALTALGLALIAFLLVIVLAFSMFQNSSSQKRERERAKDLELGTICEAPRVSADGKMANPLVGAHGHPGTKFGPRANPFGPGVIPPPFKSEKPLIFHEGVDITGIPTGTPFYAVEAGTVRGVEVGGEGGGNIIIIDSPGGHEWWYVHAANNTTVVEEGQKVEAGDHLAGAGETGVATGVHLHLQLNKDGKPVDPEPLFKEHGISIGRSETTPVERTSDKSKGGGKSAKASPKKDDDEGEKQVTELVTVPIPGGGKVKLEEAQQRNAQTIIGVGRDMGLPDEAIIIALMTAMQETRLLNLASPDVPESLKYAFDQKGVNKMSVGLFQQQYTMGWGAVEAIMNPEIATRTFFGGPTNPNKDGAKGLLDYPQWESMRPGEAAQMVQNSGHPDKYHQWEPMAKSLLSQLEGTAPTQCQSGPGPKEGEDSGKDEKAPDAEDQKKRSGEGSDPITVPDDFDRDALVKAARDGIGGEYEWGKAEKKKWDASGFVYRVHQDQGIDMPRSAQWKAGTRTESPKPGDLVAQQWDGDRNSWTHVGIYVGDGKMISAVNEETGTREHPVTQTGEPTYFTLTGKD